MTTSRTYRHLAALLAAVLFLGAFVPSMQAVCAALYVADAAPAALPCHDGAGAGTAPEAHPAVASDEGEGSWPPCCVLSPERHVLSAEDTVRPARTEAPAFVATAVRDLPHTTRSLAPVQAHPPPLVVPAPSDRSALLSTFLI